MDSFGEQLISKKITAADWIKRICLILGGLLTATFCMTLSFTTGFYVLTMIAVGILFGMVWILGGMSCEYEYIITNDDLDIDKIMGKRKRKRLITLKLSTAEEFGVYDGSQGDGAQATVIASDGSGINAYYLLAKHKSHGLTMLIFTPDRRMTGLIMGNLPRKVKNEAKLHYTISADSTEE